MAVTQDSLYCSFSLLSYWHNIVYTFCSFSPTFPESGVLCVKFGGYKAPLRQSLPQITIPVWKDFLEQ